jgi:hypothetical protein
MTAVGYAMFAIAYQRCLAVIEAHPGETLEIMMRSHRRFDRTRADAARCFNLAAAGGVVLQ